MPCLNVRLNDGNGGDVVVTSSNSGKENDNDGSTVLGKPNTYDISYMVHGWVPDGTQVEISGLHGSTACTPTAPATTCSQPLSGDSARHYGSTGLWNPDKGTLTLTTVDHSLISHDSVKTCQDETRNMILNIGHHGQRELQGRVTTPLRCKRGPLRVGAKLAGFTAAVCSLAGTSETTAGCKETTTVKTTGFTKCNAKTYLDVYVAAAKASFDVVMANDAITSITVKSIAAGGGGVPAKCTETAAVSVAADKAACEGVADLGTDAACKAVKLTNDPACTYTAKDDVAGTAATCAETAGVSVAADKAACEGVTGADLDDKTKCEAVNKATKASACTYAAAIAGGAGASKINFYPGSKITIPKTSLGYVNVAKGANNFGPNNDIVITLADADLDLDLVQCDAKEYKCVTGTTGGVTTPAKFDVTLDADGVTKIKVCERGVGYQNGDTVFIKRTDIGAVSRQWHSFKAAADVTTGVQFLAVGDQCKGTPVSNVVCDAYTGGGLNKLETTSIGQFGELKTVVTGDSEFCTAGATTLTRDVKGVVAATESRTDFDAIDRNDGKFEDLTDKTSGATFDFVFSPTKLQSVKVNAIGSGIRVGDTFTFTKEQLGFQDKTMGPLGSYRLTVTAAMLVGVFGPNEDLSFTLKLDDLECTIPHGDASSKLPMTQRVEYLDPKPGRTSDTAAWTPVKADFRLQKIRFTLTNPQTFSHARRVEVSIKNQGSSVPVLSSTSTNYHAHATVKLLNLSIKDNSNKQNLNEQREVTIKFTINLQQASGSVNTGGWVDKDTVFTVSGLNTQIGKEGDNTIALTGKSASLFGANLKQSCSPNKSELQLKTTGRVAYANKDVELTMTLTSPGYKWGNRKISIASTNVMATTAAGQTPTVYTIEDTSFPESDWNILTTAGEPLAVQPARVWVDWTGGVTVTGLVEGERFGLAKTTETCAQNLFKVTVPAGGQVSIPSAETYGTGEYGLCRALPGICASASVESQQLSTEATFTVLDPTFSPKYLVGGQDSIIFVSGAAAGDVVAVTAGDCKDIDANTVSNEERSGFLAVAADGSATIPAVVKTAKKLNVCWRPSQLNSFVEGTAERFRTLEGGVAKAAGALQLGTLIATQAVTFNGLKFSSYSGMTAEKQSSFKTKVSRDYEINYGFEKGAVIKTEVSSAVQRARGRVLAVGDLTITFTITGDKALIDKVKAGQAPNGTPFSNDAEATALVKDVIAEFQALGVTVPTAQDVQAQVGAATSSTSGSSGEAIPVRVESASKATPLLALAVVAVATLRLL
jgi:hypothetical protein